MSWVEKYKPQTSSDIVGCQYELRTIKTWLNTWPSKALLISGPPGTGKTTVVDVATKELGMDVFHIDATAKKGTVDLKQRASEFTQTSSLFGKDKKCLVLEVDKLREQSVLVSLIETTRIPIICVCNNRERLQNVVKKCREVRFAPFAPKDMMVHLKRVLTAEKRVLSNSHLLQNVASCGDMRLALNTLQMNGGNRKDLETVHWRQAVERLMNPKIPLLIRADLFYVDSFMIPATVHDMYPTTIESLDDLAKAADSISRSDLVFLDYASYMGCVTPMSLGTRRGTVPYFPTSIGKNKKRVSEPPLKRARHS
jgi:replication-associated recombination protein RarA